MGFFFPGTGVVVVNKKAFKVIVSLDNSEETIWGNKRPI